MAPRLVEPIGASVAYWEMGIRDGAYPGRVRAYAARLPESDRRDYWIGAGFGASERPVGTPLDLSRIHGACPDDAAWPFCLVGAGQGQYFHTRERWETDIDDPPPAGTLDHDLLLLGATAAARHVTGTPDPDLEARLSARLSDPAFLARLSPDVRRDLFGKTGLMDMAWGPGGTP
jgi:hypothetical protein